MATVIVNIGRGELGLERWMDFKSDLRVYCQKYTTNIYTMAEGTGYWDGETEGSYIIVGEWPRGMTPKDARALGEEFVAALDALRITYGQESIAVTVGETHLLGAED